MKLFTDIGLLLNEVASLSYVHVGFMTTIMMMMMMMMMIKVDDSVGYRSVMAWSLNVILLECLFLLCVFYLQRRYLHFLPLC